MSELLTWLTAQLDEVERRENAKTRRTWNAEARCERCGKHVDGYDHDEYTGLRWSPCGHPTQPDLAYAPLGSEPAPDPVALAHVEAHRAILEFHSGSHECSGPEDNCMWISGGSCPTVLALTSAYRHADGYLEEWKP